MPAACLKPGCCLQGTSWDVHTVGTQIMLHLFKTVPWSRDPALAEAQLFQTELP